MCEAITKGISVKVKAKSVPRFVAGKELKEIINGDRKQDAAPKPAVAAPKKAAKKAPKKAAKKVAKKAPKKAAKKVAKKAPKKAVKKAAKKRR